MVAGVRELVQVTSCQGCPFGNRSGYEDIDCAVSEVDAWEMSTTELPVKCSLRDGGSVLVQQFIPPIIGENP